MIKLRNLIMEVLTERMSYADLMRSSTPERKDRASRIPARSLAVRSVNDREAWKFSYKTPKNEITRDSENPDGVRHQGFIYFYKDDIQTGDNAMTIDCSVDCDCKDYRYRFSYANKANDAGENGPNSLNKGFNRASIINRGPGLCKHLISLQEYLKTQIDPDPVEPSKPVEPVPKTPPPEKTPPEEEEPEEIPVDKTQTPDVEEPVEPEGEEPVEDPTQTPQEPDEEEPPIEGEEEEKPEELKETNFDKNKITRALDEFCRKNPLFIV